MPESSIKQSFEVPVQEKQPQQENPGLGLKKNFLDVIPEEKNELNFEKLVNSKCRHLNFLKC